MNAGLVAAAVVGVAVLSAGVITVLPDLDSMDDKGASNPTSSATGDGEGLVDITNRIAANPSQRRYGFAAVQADAETHLYSKGFGGTHQLMKWRTGRL